MKSFIALGALLSAVETTAVDVVQRRAKPIVRTLRADPLLVLDSSELGLSMGLAAIGGDDDEEVPTPGGGKGGAQSGDYTSAKSGKAKSSKSSSPPAPTRDYFFVGHEECVDVKYNRYESVAYLEVPSREACQDKCSVYEETGSLIGYEYTSSVRWCYCLVEDGSLLSDVRGDENCPEDAVSCNVCPSGSGPVGGTEIGDGITLDGTSPACYRYGFPGMNPPSFTRITSGEDASSFCLSRTGASFDAIKFYGEEIEYEDGTKEEYGYPIATQEECAVTCLNDSRIDNLVGIDYFKEVYKSYGATIVYYECDCLVESGQLDCNDYEQSNEFLYCLADKKGKGAVLFNEEKPENYYEPVDGFDEVEVDMKCLRNDNFIATKAPTSFFTEVGEGHCRSGVSTSYSKSSKGGIAKSGQGQLYDFFTWPENLGIINNAEACQDLILNGYFGPSVVGVEYGEPEGGSELGFKECHILFNDGYAPFGCDFETDASFTGTGPIAMSDQSPGIKCYSYNNYVPPDPNGAPEVGLLVEELDSRVGKSKLKIKIAHMKSVRDRDD